MEIEHIEIAEKNQGSGDSKRGIVSGIKSFFMTPAPVEKEKVVRLPGRRRKIILGILVFLGILGVVGTVLFVFVGLPAKKTYDSAQETAAAAKAAWFGFRQQNLGVAEEKLQLTELKLLETQKNFESLKWLGKVPLVKGYIGDVDHGFKAGLAGIKAGQLAVAALTPYADLLGFEGQGSLWSGSSEERIEKAMGTLEKLTPALDGILAQMEIVRSEISYIDPNRYSFEYQGLALKDKLAEGQKILNDNLDLLIEASPLVKKAPELLGMEKPQYYLVLFQNDKELRSTGGFITAYAIFRVEKGKVFPEISEDIYNLDKRVSNKVKAPDILKKHLNVYTWNIRDSNTSPDFVKSMNNFMSMYETTGMRKNIAGIIALDTQFLVDVMKPLEEYGPIPAYGTHFTTEIDKRCDCPQVVFELERYADLRVGEWRTNRKDIIAVLMKALLDRTMASPRQTLEKLIKASLKDFEEKHLLVYLFDEEAQKGMEQLNWSGRITQETTEDYFHLNENNLGGAKSNMFIEESMEQEVALGSNGRVEKTVKITYKNPAPQSAGCNLEAKEGLCLNGTLRNWIRLYVPLGSELIEVKGSEEEIEVYDELGKTVFDGFLQVRPAFGDQAGFAQIEIRYRLPKSVVGDKYRLKIQKQPGSQNYPVKIKYKGKTVEEFELDKDKEAGFVI